MIRLEKVVGITKKTESDKIEYLWAIIGVCNITLLQVYAPTEPTGLFEGIKERYEKFTKQ